MRVLCGIRILYLSVWRCFTIGKLEHQLNEEIRDKEIRVIGEDGAQLGIMYGLKKAGVEMNRKALSELAIADSAAFAALVEMAKKAL